jgi:SAM-dependent methyltransferase
MIKMHKITKDPVNQGLIDLKESIGLKELGIMNNLVWFNDPKRLLFTMSRYKFVGKMLSGLNQVAEIGCGDGFCSRIVRQEVGELLITDYDPLFIELFNASQDSKWATEARIHDILSKPLDDKKDAVYSLDVFEHIDQNNEGIYLSNIAKSLKQDGIAIIGIPSLESQDFASPESLAGHVNCKSGSDFRKILLEYFTNVFIFSMNDEVVHTGFDKMAHYLIGLCIKPNKETCI